MGQVCAPQSTAQILDDGNPAERSTKPAIMPEKTKTDELFPPERRNTQYTGRRSSSRPRRSRNAGRNPSLISMPTDLRLSMQDSTNPPMLDDQDTMTWSEPEDNRPKAIKRKEISARRTDMLLTAANRWYEHLLQESVALDEWVEGQFNAFKTLRSVIQQKIFLKLHINNVKQLIVQLCHLTIAMREAGMAHCNMGMESIRLISRTESDIQIADVDKIAYRTKDEDDVPDRPEWIPLLEDFGYARRLGTTVKLQPPSLEALRQMLLPLARDGDFEPPEKVLNLVHEMIGPAETPSQYMPPEAHYRPLPPVDSYRDTWSIGVLMWECLSGMPLWPEASPDDQLYDMIVRRKGGFREWFKEHIQREGNQHFPFFVHPDAVDLLHKIFQHDRKDRISLELILRHKYLGDVVAYDEGLATVDIEDFAKRLPVLTSSAKKKDPSKQMESLGNIAVHMSNSNAVLSASPSKNRNSPRYNPV